MAIVFRPDPHRQRDLVGRTQDATVRRILEPHVQDRPAEEQQKLQRDLRDYLAEQRQAR